MSIRLPSQGPLAVTTHQTSCPSSCSKPIHPSLTRGPPQVYGAKPEFVRTTGERLPEAPQFDVVMCGGTLGIFLACALQLAGLSVAVVERGLVRGREQEWNIARSELRELVSGTMLKGQTRSLPAGAGGWLGTCKPGRVQLLPGPRLPCTGYLGWK